jgi:hypothetical protein
MTPIPQKSIEIYCDEVNDVGKNSLLEGRVRGLETSGMTYNKENIQANKS